MECSENAADSLSFLSDHRSLEEYPALRQYAHFPDPLLEINNEMQALKLSSDLQRYHVIRQLEANPNMANFFKYFNSQGHERRRLEDELGWYVKQLEEDAERPSAALRKSQQLSDAKTQDDAFNCLLLEKCRRANELLDARAEPRSGGLAGPDDLVGALDDIGRQFRGTLRETGPLLLELEDLRGRVGECLEESARRVCAFRERCGALAHRNSALEAEKAELERENVELEAERAELEAERAELQRKKAEPQAQRAEPRPPQYK